MARNGIDGELSKIDLGELTFGLRSRYDCELVVDSQTTATNQYTGSISATALYDGLQIVLNPKHAGTTGQATLNLTLGDGVTTTGNCGIYFTNSQILTNQYPSNSYIRMTCRYIQLIPGMSVYQWYCDTPYIELSVNGDILHGAASIYTAEGPYGFMYSPNAWVPCSTNSGMPSLTRTVDIDQGLAFRISNQSSYMFKNYHYFTTTSTAYVPTTAVAGDKLYLKGTVDGSIFTVVDFVVGAPSTVDGYIYWNYGIVRGRSGTSTYTYTLDVYDGKLWEPIAITINGVTTVKLFPYAGLYALSQSASSEVF